MLAISKESQAVRGESYPCDVLGELGRQRPRIIRQRPLSQDPQLMRSAGHTELDKKVQALSDVGGVDMAVHRGDSSKDGEIGLDRPSMSDEVLCNWLATFHIVRIQNSNCELTLRSCSVNFPVGSRLITLSTSFLKLLTCTEITFWPSTETPSKN